jgi:hypothetical protein
MSNMLSAPRGSLIVAVHTAQNPAPAEWAAFMKLLADAKHDARVLAFTDGGGPNAGQRQAFVHHAGKLGVRVPIAAVTGSVFVRSIILALSLFDHTVFVVEPPRHTEALRHLGVPATEWGQLLDQARQLGAGLNGGVPAALQACGS